MNRTEEKIEQLLHEKFQEPGFESYFLVDLTLGGNRLNVFVDGDKGITLETCQKISRFLEGYLDEEGWLGEKYTLEVSSPGISRPLILKRQYPRNIGRRVEIKLKDEEAKKQTGTLKEIRESTVVLESKVRIKEGKKKRTELVETEIPFKDIEGTYVQISFKK